MMAYRFRKRESVVGAVQRLVRECIDKAVVQLNHTGKARYEGVHEARKRFKEIRAVLRLVRSGLGDQFAVENRWYRDAGRTLAEAREAQAALETWEKLLNRFPEIRSWTEAGVVATRLKRRLQCLDDTHAGAEIARRDILGALPAARKRVARWPLEGTDFDVIRDGVARTYRQGRRSGRVAYARHNDLLFHEWRKRVKDLWYHTKLLTPIWHDAMDVRQTCLKELSDRLGDDHDLVVFAQHMAEQQRLFGTKSFCEELGARIVIRQQELRAQARELGGLLYAETAGAYARRIEAYWRSWRSPARL